MPADSFKVVLATAGLDGVRLYRADLERISRMVTTVPPDEFVDASTLAPGLTSEAGPILPANYLEIHSRHWWIDPARPDSQRHLVLTITAAMLVDGLRLPWTVRWVTEVLPTVATPVSISPHVDGLETVVRRHADPRLGAELATSVHPADFADLVDAVRRAPDALVLPVGGAVRFTDA